MKPFMRNPRTGLPALAVFVTLVLSFAIPPFNSVVAAGSSSSSSSSMSSASSSPTFDCFAEYNGGTVVPGNRLAGEVFLGGGCVFTNHVNVQLNGAHLPPKAPNSDGGVSISVQTNTDGKTGELGDPVPVTLHQGRNVVEVTGPARSPDGVTGTGEIDAFFDLGAVATTSSTSPTTIVVTPVTVQTTTGSPGAGSLARTGMNLFALFLLALVAIALGTYTIASERSLPLAAGAGSLAPAVSVPLLDPPLGVPETWTLELVVLTAVSYILGPPPGQHIKKGPRGLVPMIRDWMDRY